MFMPSPHEKSFLIIKLIEEFLFIMKNIKEYETVGEWFTDAKKEGHQFPLAMCHGIEIAQRELDLSFCEVFELFINNKIIIGLEKFYVYNLMGHLAIKNK